jgi:hypothetical protein
MIMSKEHRQGACGTGMGEKSSVNSVRSVVRFFSHCYRAEGGKR